MKIAERYASNVGAVANEIRMSRGKVFVLVEGVSDSLFLRRFVPGSVSVRSLDGRDAVVSVSRRLLTREANNFVSVVDADLYGVMGRVEDMPRLVHVSLSETSGDSCIDMESCLLRSKALEGVLLRVFGGELSREGGVDCVAKRVRQWLRLVGSQVGAYRAAVMDHSANGNRVASLDSFGELWDREWSGFCKPSELFFDSLVLESVISQFIRPESTFPALRQTAADYHSVHGAGWLLCRGHDMTRLLALYFRARSKAISTPREVENCLRAAFDDSMLRNTSFGQKMLGWILPRGSEE